MTRYLQKVGFCFTLSTLFFVGLDVKSQTTRVTSVTKNARRHNIVTEVKPLKIGDKVPDIVFEKVLNYNDKTARLSDFKGKMVILDFWATWCGSCIDVFPKVEQLQKKYDKDLQFILVNSFRATHDTEKKVRDFFVKWKSKYGKGYTIPCAIDDVEAKQLFAHSAMPHYVWIDKSGIVKAFTSQYEVNEENIQEALNNEQFRFKEKVDFFYTKPMYLGEDAQLDKFSKFSMFIKGKLENVHSIFQPRIISSGDGNTMIRGWAARNVPLLDLFVTTFKSDSGIGKYHLQKQLLLEVNNLDALKYEASKFEIDTWERNNLYTYDLIVPIEQADSVFIIMRSDLNYHTNFKATIERRKVNCWVLKKVRNIDERMASVKNNSKEPYSTERLTIEMNISDRFELPIFDESDYKEMVYLNRDVDFKNIESLKQALSRYGLEIVQSTRDMDMYVISDK